MPSQPCSAGSELPTATAVQLGKGPRVVSLIQLPQRREWMRHNTNALGVVLRNWSKSEENKQHQGVLSSWKRIRPSWCVRLVASSLPLPLWALWKHRSDGISPCFPSPSLFVEHKISSRSCLPAYVLAVISLHHQFLLWQNPTAYLSFCCLWHLLFF